ncbi:MAG: pyridoxal-phosphate dependent enzyme, partial [Burkholderiales bacterium]|nr:pyridoxal-phosphate dependent enzyme [Burkholderiales bacterium]
MFAVNPRATRESYPDDLRPVLSVDEARRTREWLSAWDGLAPGATPLLELPDLAQRLGLAGVSLKDESVRSPLGSFKALGAPAALVRLVMRLHP